MPKQDKIVNIKKLKNLKIVVFIKYHLNFPINLGQFGFIAGISPSNWTEKLNDFIQGKLAVAKRTLLNIKVFRNEKEIFLKYSAFSGRKETPHSFE